MQAAAAVSAALAKDDWKAVLDLDPDNSAGLRMQAAAEKAAAEKAAADKVAAVNSALAKGNWKAVLALDPGNKDGLRLQAAMEKAAAITAALSKRDWKAVLALDPDNSVGLRMQAAEEKAAADKAAAVSAALAKGDWKAVLALDPDTSKGLRMQVVAERAAAVKAAAEVLARAPITNTIGMTLKEIPAGTFMMGSPEDETGRYDDEHQHKVTITKAFYMQTTEVTQGQWMAVMGSEPWKGKSGVNEGANYAATWVSWDDAVAYCEKLSEREGEMYRLPSEAEWEYACRAGAETRWSFGDDEKELGDYAWYQENASNAGENYAHQVRLKKPNAFGLYDMHGNVWEWCHDYYGEDYYKQSPEHDPQGPASSAVVYGSTRVLRGGSWVLGTWSTRSAYRSRNPADGRYLHFGFRVVRELD
jgi:formylglycine-generating enzyme required for sulfatase activity